jgi:hypothetical protein
MVAFESLGYGIVALELGTLDVWLCRDLERESEDDDEVDVCVVVGCGNCNGCEFGLMEALDCDDDEDVECFPCSDLDLDVDVEGGCRPVSIGIELELEERIGTSSRGLMTTDDDEDDNGGLIDICAVEDEDEVSGIPEL